MSHTFQQAVMNLAFDPAASALYANTPWTEVLKLSKQLSEKDAYREHLFLEHAIRQAFPSNAYTLEDYITHQLWCAWREAQWQNGLLDLESTPLRVVNEHYYLETLGYPTLLVSPMTTTLSDAVLLIKHLAGKERSVILYGEGIDTIQQGNTVSRDWLAGSGLQALKRIQKTLSRNGILCTYPDFVYAGHSSMLMPFFKSYRPVASGFISLASRRHSQSNTMLLPCVVLHTDEQITVHFEEPIEIELATEHHCSKEQRQAAIAHLVGETLETLIELAGPQWLLLPTLTYDSPQMGHHTFRHQRKAG